MNKRTGPYGLSDEQTRAYAAQIAEEKKERAAAPKSEALREFVAWLRQDGVAADQIKFGDHWLNREDIPDELSL